MRIAAIIPAYNEADAVGTVVEELRNDAPSATPIVVNDCSTDTTADVVRSTDAVLLSLPQNLGIGGAVQTGLKYARDNKFDIAVQIDGDGQHIAAEIEKIAAPIVDGQADVVIGSRFLDNKSFRSTAARRVGINLISMVNSMLVGQKITDNTSGFRAFNRRAIEFLAVHYPQDYPEPVAVVELFRNRFRMVEVPVEMRERTSGESSIGSLSAIYYMIKVLTASIVAYTRQPVRMGGE